jgi:D-alanyl-D-alanine carboxypeptidase
LQRTCGDKGNGAAAPGWRLAGLVLAAALLAFATSPALAKYASLVIDADSGRVLHAVNADTRNYPASLTKMMTLYMVFEALDAGRWSLKTRLGVSPRAARQPASRLGLRRGQSIRVRQAILALVTKSANDVASAVAEALGGSERKFALMMTAKARALGMTRTTFRNASGLPHRGQLTTARDMSRLAQALLTKKRRHYHFFATSTFRWGGAAHRNHNKLLGSYDGADGIKTGYIRASGFNLVASATRGSYRLVGVVLGGRSPGGRDRHMASLLDKGFRRVDTTLAVASAPKAKSKAKSRQARRAKTRPRHAAKPPAGKAKSPRWGVQVGAYRTTGPAYAIARKAVARAPDALDGGVIRVVPLRQPNRKPVYRARILGISKRDAYRACRTLKRHRMSCMELRMRKDLQLASR